MDKPIEGFTLIETMVVLILMSIILAMGMPSFMNLIEKMSTESEAKALIESLRTARLVAIEEKQRVVVCPSTDGDTCNNDWDTGFFVYRDNNDSKTRDAGEEILINHRFQDSVLVKKPGAGTINVYYNESGWSPGSAGCLLVCAKEGQEKNSFSIVVNRAGRIRVESETNCPSGDGC